MSMSKATSFPWEVIEAIVDGCAQEVGSLRAFALTCRSLLPRSRQHLFAAIRVTSNEERVSICKFLEDHPTFRSLIRSISFLPDTTRGVTDAPIEVIPFPAFYQFRHLLQLSLCGNRSRQTAVVCFHPMVLPLLRTSHPLEELHLSKCRFASCTQYLLFVYAFPHLRRLHLDGIRFQSDGGGCPDVSELRDRGPLRLSTLVVATSPSDLVAVRSILYLNRLSLLHLKFDVSEMETSKMIRLRSMTITMDRGDYTRHIDALDKLLSSLLSNRLNRLALVFPSESHSLRHQFIYKVTLDKLEHFLGARCDGHLRLQLRFTDVKMNRTEQLTPKSGNACANLHGRQVLDGDDTLACRSNEHYEQINALVVSPDGLLFASGSDDGSVLLWDALQPHIVVKGLFRRERTVHSLAYSPDGNRLAAGAVAFGCRKPVLIVWSIQEGRLVVLFGHKDDICRIAWSPDGSLLVSTSVDKTAMLWNAKSSFNLIRRLDIGSCSHVTFSPDGRWLVTGHSDDPGFAVWDLRTRQPVLHSITVPPLQCPSEARHMHLTIDPSSRRIAMVFAYDLRCGIYIQSIAGTAQDDITILTQVDRYGITELIFSPDGKTILSASADSTLQLWDSFTGNLLLSLEGHADCVSAARFSPDGKYVASGSHDKTVRLWRTSDGACVATFAEHGDSVTHVVFTPDGQTLASASHNGTVCIRRLCDVVTGY